MTLVGQRSLVASSLRWSSFLVGGVFALIGLFSVGNSLLTTITWHSVVASVTEINLAKGNAPYSFMTIGFVYDVGSGQRLGWAYHSEPSNRGQGFLREYSVGSRHNVYVDPHHPASVAIEVGWQPRFLLTPIVLITFSFSLCLFWSGWYFFRIDGA